MRKINALCDNILKMEVNFKRQLSRLHPEIKELFDKQKALLAKAEKELDKTGFAAFQGRMMDEGVLKECDILVDHAAQQIADLNYKEAKQVITKLQSQLDYIKGQVAELEASLVSLIISQQHSQLVVGQLAGQVAVLKRRVAAFKNLDYGGVEDLEKQLLGIEANLNALKILADDKTLSTDQANILKSSESHVAAVVKALKFKEDRLERENDERWDKLWEDAEELRSKEWYEHETVFNSYLFSQKERLRHIIDPLSKYHAMTLVRKQIRDVYRISAGIGTLDEMKSTIDAQLATPFEDYTKV